MQFFDNIIRVNLIFYVRLGTYSHGWDQIFPLKLLKKNAWWRIDRGTHIYF